jgi:NDP-sugar pyrophosphorylase family protein
VPRALAQNLEVSLTLSKLKTQNSKPKTQNSKRKTLVSSLPIVILAGGLANRLRPLTEKIPKALVEVAGRPFLEHQIELLKRNLIEEVILCVGYLGEMIEERYGDGETLYSKRQKLPEMRYFDYGLMICSRQIFDDSAGDVPFDLADTLENLSRKGELTGYEVSQRFCEIGSPAGLAELHRLLSGDITQRPRRSQS